MVTKRASVRIFCALLLTAAMLSGCGAGTKGGGKAASGTAAQSTAKTDDKGTGKYEIENGGFETGDLTGWKVVEGKAFGDDCITTADTFWDQKIPFNKVGNWHLFGIGDSGIIPESATGKLQSSTFTLGGDGTVSMKLGAGQRADKCYVAVYLADNNKLIAKQGNTEFVDPGVADPAKYSSGLAFTNNYAEYKLDLKQYLGKKMYLVIVDSDTDSGFGFIIVDDIRTYYVNGKADPQAEGAKHDKVKNSASAAQVQAASKYEIANPGFELGNLNGWKIESGAAFSDYGVTDQTTWWAEAIPYNGDGKYWFGMYNEGAVGKLRSSTFELGGSGWITFKLGGGKDATKCYISVYNADTQAEVARFGNTLFADKNFPHVDQGMNLANMVQYKADLSKYLGKNLYLEIVDDATADWGLMTFDSFNVYNQSAPAEGNTASPLLK